MASLWNQSNKPECVYNKIMKPSNKTAYLVFALLGIVILIMLVQVLKFSEKPNPSSNQNSSPPPVTQFTPTPKFRIVSTNITSQPLEVNRIIKLDFDQPVDNENLRLEISPKEEVVILFNPSLTELSVKPTNAWDFNTRYTIKVSKSTKSQNKEFLDQDYEFSFQTESYVGI